MKKILGIISSRRKIANGEILLKEACSAGEEDYQLELIRLPDLKLEPCKGCYSCLIPGKLCPLGDDLYYLADKIKAADGVIISSPCYVLGPAAITKLLSDRTIALARLLDDFWGKPCVIIGTAGIKEWEGYTMSALMMMARSIGLDVKDAHMFIGALPGEAVEIEGALPRIRQLGKALFGEKRGAENGQCPTCWSDLWKFPKPNMAVCPICGQEASLIINDSSLVWEYGPSGPRLGYEQLKKHFQEWLPEKAQEYGLRRKELELVRNKYKNQGQWLTPRT
ncbi:NADPH-dependent FMN reductase [Desulfosporosinus orientis DSM 765]|uniref:NADPH-dependent FMN reductase n=1 Tax=Desulfosporosinus orientis (strain ATCC 19365 / DSM 765 / NCIMB 8382 / VKM B-1628 / Singapore I) TaxID=768706 RepID=G7WHT2_DESOD|nr:flavodoxin family protein [Desulfosporosinus orientis]AET69644.1 NADPH-dependent FMN reductase [Desulfosporosinus orientis DSM 765]